MINLIYDCYQILNKVYSQKTFVKQAMNSTVIDEKNRSAVTKICYGVLERDIELNYYIKSLCKKSPKLAIRTILKIAMYQIKYLGKKDYAVVDNSVELAKKLGKGGVASFINGTLRKFIKSTPEVMGNKLEKLSVEYSYPAFAVKMLISDYGEEMAREIMKGDINQTTIRFKPGFDYENYLNDRKINFELSPFKNCVFANGFTMDSGFIMGDYTFQSIGSVAICDAVSGGDSLIDVCSAPGGKAVNLAEKFNSVVALELHEHRLELIKKYKDRMNVKNVTEILHDSTKVKSEFVDKFDCVLADVPCSGFGVVADQPDIKINREQADILELNKIQLDILKASCQYAKVGASVYYSTCSVFKCENQGVINEFLVGNDKFIVQPIESSLPHIKLDVGLQFLPHISHGAGFYICKLKRVK